MMYSFPNHILHFSRIVGGLPLKYTSGPEGTKTLKFSVTGFVWSLTLILLQEILSCICLYFGLVCEVDGRPIWYVDKTTKLTTILYVFCLQVMSAVTFFSYLWKYPRLVNVCDILELVYRNLQHTTLKVKVRVKVLVISTSAVLLLVIITISEQIMFQDTMTRSVFSAINYSTILLLFSTEVAFIVHFTHITQCIAKGFRMVNVKIKEEITSHIFDQMMNPSLSRGVLTHITPNNLFKVQKLKTLMNTYRLLCDAAHQANTFYCDQLMAAVFCSFVYITTTSYFTLFLSSFFLESSYEIIIGTEAAWLLAHLFFVVLVMNTSTDVTNSCANDDGRFKRIKGFRTLAIVVCYQMCNTTFRGLESIHFVRWSSTNTYKNKGRKEENKDLTPRSFWANETAPLICKLINKDLDPSVSKQLETFLLELLHHNARFSALGFFQIHNATLTTMAGAVITYLVILIKFETQPPPN